MIDLNLPAWIPDALCAQTDPGLFHADHSGESPTAAKRICASCPVREACLESASSLPAHEDRWGVYGGLSERERRKLRAERQAAA